MMIKRLSTYELSQRKRDLESLLRKYKNIRCAKEQLAIIKAELIARHTPHKGLLDESEEIH